MSSWDVLLGVVEDEVAVAALKVATEFREGEEVAPKNLDL
jgi:hypothetical protein